MKVEKIITASILTLIFILIWVVTDTVKDFIILSISTLLTGVIMEIFYWRRARKEGKKDLIDLLTAVFKKNSK